MYRDRLSSRQGMRSLAAGQGGIHLCRGALSSGWIPARGVQA